MTKAITTVDQYIAAAPAERQATLKRSVKPSKPFYLKRLKNQLSNAYLSSGRKYRAFCLRQTASWLLSHAFCDHGLPRRPTTLQNQ